jgi:hypothetical protein
MTLLRTHLVFCICLMVFTTAARGDCAHPALTNERQDVATIQRLENSWTLAFLTGDTDFEKCLLTSDFTEIMGNGNIDHLNDELNLAKKNRGKAVTIPNLSRVTVHLHGDVAVAYGFSENVIDGKPYRFYFADYYVWENGVWRVYFAQQTKAVNS